MRRIWAWYLREFYWPLRTFSWPVTQLEYQFALRDEADAIRARLGL